MTNNILWPVARDKNNNLIEIYDVQKEKEEVYTCIDCGTEMIPRQGSEVAWHFAHKSIGECNGEGVRHWSMIMDLKKKLLSGKIITNLVCKCGAIEPYRIYINTESVKVNTKIGNSDFRPDIQAETSNGMKLVIEVVNTHYPEENTLTYYMDNDIACFIVHVDRPLDIELKSKRNVFCGHAIQNGTRGPDNVFTNVNVKCAIWINTPTQYKTILEIGSGQNAERGIFRQLSEMRKSLSVIQKSADWIETSVSKYIDATREKETTWDK